MADRLLLSALAAVLGACGGSNNKPEIVVRDATIDGAAPVIIGATAETVSWSASPGAGTTSIAAASLASLPAQGNRLATASGPVAPAGDQVLFAADHLISRVGIDGAVLRLTTADPEALAGSSDAVPVMAWTLGPVVSWGIDDVQMTATFTKIDRCDHARVTGQRIYVAADGASGRRLLRIDQSTGVVTPITSSSIWAPMFPGGGMAGATYRGRIVDANDDGALWLIEEMPSRRGIVVLEPVQGEASVLLEHVTGATGFFASQEALYWQEGDALLTAPRTGGAASIIASLPGPAGALADGYVYFTDGAAIERLRVE
ncbi:MAG TPA: hypothetical protein VLB44_14880 [Kofleriaceae bacterium]|nr:hypothetical protein [Kofleriaceae bacterium]